MESDLTVTMNVKDLWSLNSSGYAGKSLQVEFERDTCRIINDYIGHKDMAIPLPHESVKSMPFGSLVNEGTPRQNESSFIPFSDRRSVILWASLLMISIGCIGFFLLEQLLGSSLLPLNSSLSVSPSPSESLEKQYRYSSSLDFYRYYEIQHVMTRVKNSGKGLGLGIRVGDQALATRVRD